MIFSSVEPLQRAAPELLRDWATALLPFKRVTADPAGLDAGDKTAAMTCAWLDSDTNEQRVLGQLAIGGYANPNPSNLGTLHNLRARGLLSSETLTFVDRDFERFVRSTVTPAAQQSWNDADRGSAWNALRIPLTTGVASLLLAVGISKPELGVASALVPTLTAGLPSVVKILIQMVTKAPDSGSG